MGKNEAWLTELAIEEGRPLPKSIIEAPTLDDFTERYYLAFGDLSRARGFTSGGVSHPIAFEAIDRYADRFEFYDFDNFYRIISNIDNEYLKQEVKRRASEDRKKKAKGRRK